MANRTKRPDVNDPDRALTAREASFVEQYLLDMKLGAAAERIGTPPGASGMMGYRMMKRPAVRAAVDKAIAARSERTGIDADTVLREILRIARADIGQAFDENGCLLPIHLIPDDVRRSIAGIDLAELGFSQTTTLEQEAVDAGVMPTTATRIYARVRKVRFWDKTRALELLMRHLGLLRDKVEHTGKDGAPLNPAVVIVPATAADMDEWRARHALPKS